MGWAGLSALVFPIPMSWGGAPGWDGCEPLALKFGPCFHPTRQTHPHPPSDAPAIRVGYRYIQGWMRGCPALGTSAPQPGNECIQARIWVHPRLGTTPSAAGYACIQGRMQTHPALDATATGTGSACKKGILRVWKAHFASAERARGHCDEGISKPGENSSHRGNSFSHAGIKRLSTGMRPVDEGGRYVLSEKTAASSSRHADTDFEG